MKEIRIAAAQFENRDNDKQHNLSRIEALTRRAADQGAEIVSFHEGCVPGYTWIQPLDKQQLLAAAEPVPEGPSTRRLIEIAAEFKTIAFVTKSSKNKRTKVATSVRSHCSSTMCACRRTWLDATEPGEPPDA